MTQSTPHAELMALEDALTANERDARRLVAGLAESLGGWQPAPGSWSIAQCLDHLATANRVYLGAMTPTAAQGVAAGRRRLGPAEPGIIGRWFVASLEPPATSLSRRQAPSLIRPRSEPPLHDAMAAFLASHDDVRAFIQRYDDTDLAGLLFPNPFVRAIRFSLATGLHVIAAHERRHLWQARQVRQKIESATQSHKAGHS